METEWLDALFRTKTPVQAALDKVRSKSQTDASIMVRVKATYYPYMAKVYVPSKAYPKLLEGMEAQQKFVRTKRTKPQSEDDKERSMRRTKNSVRDYVLCNRFDLFCTFTFKEDRHDIDKCRAKMSNWLKLQQKRQGKFAYLIVPELHEDGALHFHALFKDYYGKLKVAVNPHDGKPIIRSGKPVYNFVSYTLGHTTVQKIGDSAVDHAKVSGYVRKYITKDMPLFFGKNRFWHSKKLVMPRVQYNPPDWYLHERPDKIYENEYGTTYLFLNNYVIPSRYRFELFKVQTLPGILGDTQK